MKQQPLFTISLAALLVLSGCSAASRLESSLGTKYTYSYLLTSPKPAGKLTFLDHSIKIVFLIDQGAIRFKLTNLSGRTMTVGWQNASLSVLERHYTVLSTRSYYSADSNKTVSPAIQPGGYVIDMALPSPNVYYDGAEWREKDLLPTTDRHSAGIRKRILANKGGILSLLLPMNFEGTETVNYLFQFKVAAVSELPWQRYRAPHRPPPPPAPHEVTTNDQLITAAIIAGVVGLSAILLTQKKSPPSE